MSLFNPSRDQVRQFFFETWRKFREHKPLSALELMALEIMQMHTEYHYVLDAPERYLERTYFPEMGETNPFLHMSLHLSILEQISIDQPSGIRPAYQSLRERFSDEHRAQHELMECLAEVLWQSQHSQKPLDAETYLGLMHQKLLGSA